MVKLCIDRKNINIGKLYNQVQVAWRTIEEVLREADPDYIEKKWDRQRKRQNKRLKKLLEILNLKLV